MFHIVHLIERRFGPRAPRIILSLALLSAAALVAGLVLAKVV